MVRYSVTIRFGTLAAQLEQAARMLSSGGSSHIAGCILPASLHAMHHARWSAFEFC